MTLPSSYNETTTTITNWAIPNEIFRVPVPATAHVIVHLSLTLENTLDKSDYSWVDDVAIEFYNDGTVPSAISASSPATTPTGLGNIITNSAALVVGGTTSQANMLLSGALVFYVDNPDTTTARVYIKANGGNPADTTQHYTMTTYWWYDEKSTKGLYY